MQLARFTYVAVLAFCLVVTVPLGLVLGTRVYARWRRLALSLVPVLVPFLAWDAYALAAGHWRFDDIQTVGVRLPGGLPVEEVAFFVVIPACAVLTLEAVRAVRGWRVGDEG